MSSEETTTSAGIPKAMMEAAGTAAFQTISRKSYCADEVAEAVLVAAGVPNLWKSACEYKEALNVERRQFESRDMQSEIFCKELVIRCADGLRALPVKGMRHPWIESAANECAKEVLVGAGAVTFATIIERHFAEGK